jgi:hypothetical protein
MTTTIDSRLYLFTPVTIGYNRQKAPRYDKTMNTYM